MPERPFKILAIVFKFLGDVVVSIPALRALKEARPEVELHVLVAEEAHPLVKTLPWIDRAWALPRTRGRARLRDTWPMIRALRAEKFDLSIDLIGNDRGAFLTLAVGAREKLGLHAPKGFFGRRYFYHEALPEAPGDWHETKRHLHFLRKLGVAAEAPLALELHADPALQDDAAKILPRPTIIAHVSTSKPLKEWPQAHWSELAKLARADGHEIVFASGPAARERDSLRTLGEISPEIPQLPPIKDLGLYLAVLARASLLVSGDTGPMHFAAALGTPTLSLFGPSLIHQWAPQAPLARWLQAPSCTCSAHQESCTATTHCLNRLSPAQVWSEAKSLLQAAHDAKTKPLVN